MLGTKKSSSYASKDQKLDLSGPRKIQNPFFFNFSRWTRKTIITPDGWLMIDFCQEVAFLAVFKESNIRYFVFSHSFPLNSFLH